MTETSNRIQYVERRNWPPLAWFATCGTAGEKLQVMHGSRVETHSTWFGEVVWDGAYDLAGFDRTDLVYGSAGKLADDAVVFVSSATTMDRLHSIQLGDRFCVSNSLACLLSEIDADVDTLYPHYPHDFTSIIRGLEAYKKSLRTSKGDVLLTYHDNLRLGRGRLAAESKPTPERDLSSFAKYRSFLESALCRCGENLRSTSRRHRFELLGTISTGFDSPTVAALARQAGLKEVFTIAKSRRGKCDSGAEIARILELNATVLERNDWQTGALVEVPFLASDAKGEDVYFSSAQPLLSNRVVLTGFAAGAWKRNGALNTGLTREDQSGLSLTEYRLWTGFINVPVPTMGLGNLSGLEQMIASDEMASWHSGRGYDKPFCRRVLVEAGVSDEMFGIEKKMASVLMHDRNSFLSPASSQSYFEHLRQARSDAPCQALRRSISDLQAKGESLAVAALQSAARPASRILPIPIVKRFAHSIRLGLLARREPRFRYLFPWAIEHAKQRYFSRPSHTNIAEAPFESKKPPAPEAAAV